MIDVQNPISQSKQIFNNCTVKIVRHTDCTHNTMTNSYLHDVALQSPESLTHDKQMKKELL